MQLLALTPVDIPDSLERTGKVIGAITVLLGVLVMLLGSYHLDIVSYDYNYANSLIDSRNEIFQHAKYSYSRKVQACWYHCLHHQYRSRFVGSHYHGFGIRHSIQLAYINSSRM